MENRRALAIGAAVLALLAIVAFFLPTRLPSSSGAGPSPTPVPSSSNGLPVVGRTPGPGSPTPSASQLLVDPRRATVLSHNADGYAIWPGAEAATAALDQPGQSARDDIQAVHTVLSAYHSVFGETPLGGLNEEITRGLLGDNPKKIAFLTLPKSALGPAGELLDRWGTPYFFHKLSRDLIDLRSAGPDHKMFTADDIFEQSTGGPPL